MTAVKPYRQMGPETYTVSQPVTGGMLVMPDGTTGKIKPATAGATTVLGVAADDALPAGSGSPLAWSTLTDTIAVYSAPHEVAGVVFAASAAFGAKVKAAANGQVTPWVSGTDGADLLVGHVTSEGGVASGAPGRIKLL